MNLKKNDFYTPETLIEKGWKFSHPVGCQEVWKNADGDLLFYDSKHQKVDTILKAIKEQ